MAAPGGAERERPAVEAALDAVVAAVEQARGLPLSRSASVDRGELLELLERVRAALPGEVERARQVLQQRDELLATAQRHADALVQAAREEADRLVTEDEVRVRAEEEADRLLEDARAAAETMQLQADDYVDARLATFEITLHRTLEQVERGRATLAGRTAHDDLSELDPRG